MEPRAIVEGLCAFEGRVAGSDAERRAASWLAQRIRADGRDAQVETLWVRPDESLALALHALLAAAGSVLTAFAPVAGVAVVAAALVSLGADLTGRLFLLRRLTFRRATQNVVSPAPEGAHRVRLVIAAAYDARRGGLLRRPFLARLAARPPGPRAVLVLLVALALAAAAARLLTDATWVGAVQLVPTVALLIAFATLAEAALASPSPGAGDASAVAVALALCAALRRSPPRRLGVELVLAGAGAGPALGMRHHVRERLRSGVRPEQVAVLHLEPCGRGTPRWWTRDGPLLPLALHPRLRAAARRVAAREAHLHATPYSGHGATGAYVARAGGWPAIAIGCLQPPGVVPGRGRPEDTPETVDHEAVQGALALCLALVVELDAELDEEVAVEAAAAPATAASR